MVETPDPSQAERVCIVSLQRAHVRRSGRVLAASLMDEPAYRHIFPDPERRRAALRPFLTAPVRDAQPFGTAHAAMVDGALVGASVWLPPGSYPWSAVRKLRSAPALVAAFWAAPRAFPTLVRLGAGIERAFPDEPVWYLEVMGVAPEAQGRGLGARLLEPTLARADCDGRPCYLETATPENVGFYERFGFRVDRELSLLPEGPVHWAMRRPAE